MDPNNDIEIGKKRKSRKITVDWTEELVLKLIRAVAKQPELWDASMLRYRKKETRYVLWRNIAHNVFHDKISALAANAKWQGLRCQFKDHWNKKNRSEIGAPGYVVRWKYFEMLSFLNGDEEDKDSASISNLREMQLNSDASSLATASASTSVKTQPKRKKPMKSKLNDDEERYNVLLERIIETMDKPQDNCQIFGNFVAQQMRGMSVEDRKGFEKIVQRAILNITDTPPIKFEQS